MNRAFVPILFMKNIIGNEVIRGKKAFILRALIHVIHRARARIGVSSG